MEKYMWIVSLGSALLGALVGGCATYHFNKKHAAELEGKQRRNLARALRVELLTLWNRYMNTNGQIIEKADEKEPPLIGFSASNKNYFVIFDNSSDLLGLLDLDVAEEVVKTYVNAKAFLDELISYGNLARRYQEAQLEKLNILAGCGKTRNLSRLLKKLQMRGVEERGMRRISHIRRNDERRR